jgi:di/tricarboxylate transporter
MLDTVRGVLPDWPEWALDVLLVMTVLLITTLVFTSFYTSDDEKTENTSSSKQLGELRNKFDKFRKKYMAVYLVVMLADWM